MRKILIIFFLCFLIKVRFFVGNIIRIFEFFLQISVANFAISNDLIKCTNECRNELQNSRNSISKLQYYQDYEKCEEDCTELHLYSEDRYKSISNVKIMVLCGLFVIILIMFYFCCKRCE